jgi:hypothetical protein
MTLSVVKQHLKNREWTYVEKDNSTVLFGVEVENIRFQMAFHWLEKNDQLLLYAYFPENVSEKKRNKMAVLLTHINFGIVIGNFEMDLADGCLRYKTSIDTESLLITEKLIENMINATVATFNHYYFAIKQATYKANFSIKEVATVH